MIKLLLLGIVKLIGSLPLSMVRGLGCFIGFIFGHVVRHHRKAALASFARCFPDKSDAEVVQSINQMYRLQGIHFVEFVWYSVHGLDAVRGGVRFEGEEHMKAALAKGKGALALTAHLGNFELMPMATAAYGYKLSVIVKLIKNAAVNEVVSKLRAHEGIEFLGSRNAYRDCLKALRRNEVVGMIIDQNMTRSQGIFVDFFGKRASTSPGLAYMAAQSGAPVVPVFIYREEDGRFCLKIMPPIDPPESRKPEQTHAATLKYNQVVEEAIRKAPEQWIWMHRRWKTQPVEGKGTFRGKNRDGV